MTIQKITKHYWLITTVLIGLIIIFLALTIYFQFQDKTTLRTVFKTITSLWFLVIGIFGLLFAKNKSSKIFWIFYTALIFAFLGDILITLNFMAGMAMFAITQILLIVTYYFIKKIGYTEWIIFGLFIIFDFCLLFLYQNFEFTSTLKIAVIIYALLISFMVSKSFSLLHEFKRNQPKIILIILGSILFFASDFVLLFNEFDINLANDPKAVSTNVVSAINLILYYIGLVLLVISLKYPLLKKHKKIKDL